MKHTTKFLEMATRYVAAVILLYSLAGKFYGGESAVYVFSKLGLDPYGRYAVGALEAVAVILLLIPATSWKGSLLGVFITFGAICMHLNLLEISVAGDGGVMFGMAIIVMGCCLANLGLHKQDFLSWA